MFSRKKQQPVERQRIKDILVCFLLINTISHQIQENVAKQEIFTLFSTKQEKKSPPASDQLLFPLKLWKFLIDDLKSLGAKKFYGKFSAGAINHVNIRTLQVATVYFLIFLSRILMYP
jgi:hypothetical protein